ncbi:unnamed protein product, partial [Rotaria magnacalcarata]
ITMSDMTKDTDEVNLAIHPSIRTINIITDSDVNEVNVAVKPKVDWRRPKATKSGCFCSEPQQDLEEYANNLEFEVSQLYHLLGREMSSRQKLEGSVDHLTKMCGMQEWTLVELKRDARRLRAMPNKIDAASDWVVRGMALVQEHIQG